jgi:hypothetical protein
MFSRRNATKGRRRSGTQFGVPMLHYGDTLKTEMRLRRREEKFHIPS